MSGLLKRTAGAAWRTLLLLVLLTLLALGWLLGTESGLRWSLRTAGERLPLGLSVEEARGRWLDRVEFTRLAIDGDAGRYAVEHLLLDWSPPALLRGELLIETLHANGVRALPAPAGEPPPADDAPFAPGWRLPLGIRIRDLAIDDVEWSDPARPEQPFRIDRARLVADAAGTAVRLDTLSIQAPLFDIEGHGELSLAREDESSLRVDWRARPPTTNEFAGQLDLQGGWDNLTIENRLQRPFAALTRLTVDEVLHDPSWSLLTRFEPVRLDTVGADLPPQRVGLDLTASGTTDRATFETHALTDALDGELQPFDLQGTVQRLTDAGGGFRIDGVSLRRRAQPGEITLAGTWLTGGRIDLDLNWRDLAWPLGAAPRVASQAGTVALHGTLDDYRLAANFDTGGTGIPASVTRLAGRGDAGHLDIEALDVALLDGNVRGDGRVDWAPRTAWKLDLTARGIDPGVHWPDYPGRVAAHAHTEGTIVAGTPPRATLLLDDVSGTLRTMPLAGKSRIDIADEVTRIDTLDLSLGDARASVQGRVADRLDLHWTLVADRLDRLSPDLAGRLDSKGALSGPRATPNVQASLNMKDLRFGGAFAVGMLETTLDGGLERNKLNVDLHATELDVAQRHLNDVRGFVQGNLDHHAIRVRGLGPDTELALDGSGAWRDAEGAWEGQISALRLRLTETGAWALARPIAVHLGRDRITTSDSCLKGGIASPPALLCASVRKDAHQWRVDARTANLSLEQAGAWLPPGTQARGSLSGVARIGGRTDVADRPTELALDLFLSPGGFAFDESVEPREVTFKGGRVESALENGSLNGECRLRLVGDDQLTGRWRLPAFQWRDPARQKLELDLDGDVRDLTLVDAWVPAVEALKGEARVKLRARGTLGHPQVSGEAGFDGAMDVPHAGIQLADVKLALQAATLDRLQLSGHARSGEGALDLDGSLDLRDTQFLAGELHLNGDRFLATDLREARVLVSPELRARLDKRDIAITGKVRIPEARLRQNGGSGRVTESSDVVVIEPDQGDAAEQATPYRVTTDVQIVLDDKVRFEGYGLATDLEGMLRVTQTPGALMTGNGAVELKNGTYEAYGQKLTIEAGRIYYTGGPISRPGIDLRATRKTGDVTAGVKVSGTVQNPTTELYSEPAMPQSEALSYLLLGRPLNQASSEEGEMLANAAMSIGLKGGNLLAEQLGGTFGLDELRFESGTTYRDASVVVGKYLTPKLYVDYSVGLIDAINRLRMRYDLTEHWAVQTETGAETGGDLLFTIER